MGKVSIRFYKDHEVRAVWDEEHSKWWFSVIDIIRAINNEADYNKNHNYWKYLKTKLKREGSEVVSVTNQMKLVAPDGKNIRLMCSTKVVWSCWLKTSQIPRLLNFLIGLLIAITPLMVAVGRKRILLWRAILWRTGMWVR